mmetsp:Transcript_30419/g.72946  ORF Transcript_30419/g.72946 Transcript_30419/m.72946 type:complete len:608 (-) Transcript_30419:703-2526(-)|eukprot:CAMPEP_0113643314 /NCGR_PEP_ID=MMETSP0017_2-20120614/22772_1 /TAXON_ID=2856 /ORGANISM="Cylindrotheca closterium" /LENGTH=607 /DNA_ID=CAMNT_0000554817 /DNA_START=50 /DNA_END=1873 /DNA_ORIENTATION=- /assembly_acc=CAM_ASM_000147
MMWWAMDAPTKVYYIRRAKRCEGSKQKDYPNKKIPENQSSPLEVDEKKRRFVMDMILWESDLEVGSVDGITKELKTYLTDFHGGLQFATIGIQLEHNESMNCPFLVSLNIVESSGQYGGFQIYPLSGNLQDILQVLLQSEISSFNLEFVHEKYIAAVKEFLSTNPYFRKLCIGEHYLKKDQDFVRDVVRSSNSLSTLEFTYITGTRKEPVLNQSLNGYMRHIYESKSLKKLDLSKIGSLLSQEPIDSLAKGLLDNKSSKLKTIDISVRRYAELKFDITKLARALKYSDALEELNVGKRKLASFESIRACAKLLKRSNKCLKKLDLRAHNKNRRIHPDAWIYMGKALQRTCSLQYLDISFHRVSEGSWKALGEGLKTNTSLLTLKAVKPHYQREDKETNILLPVFEALHENRTLQSLHLEFYDLSDSFACLEVLESALVENTSLKSLQLPYSSMTDKGVAILSRGLPKMKSIEKLGLEHHDFSLKGSQALARGIKSNYNLLSVGIGTKLSRFNETYFEPPVGAEGFEREWHEIQYYARMNRKGRRCIGSKAPVKPSLWPMILANTIKKEKPFRGLLVDGDVRKKDYFAGKHDTSIDAVFFFGEKCGDN